MFRTNFDVPSLHTYELIKEFYEKTKPIRGMSKEYHGVPLNKNRRQWQHQCVNKYGDTYTVRLYNTHIVKFDPDNTITISVWDSRTTRLLINEVLRGLFRKLQCGLTTMHGQQYLHQCAPNESTRGSLYHRLADSSEFTIHLGENQAMLEHFSKLQVRRLDKRAAAKIRKEHADKITAYNAWRTLFDDLTRSQKLIMLHELRDAGQGTILQQQALKSLLDSRESLLKDLYHYYNAYVTKTLPPGDILRDAVASDTTYKLHITY